MGSSSLFQAALIDKSPTTGVGQRGLSATGAPTGTLQAVFAPLDESAPALAAAGLPDAALFAAHRSFIRAASFARASGVSRRFFFFGAATGFVLPDTFFFGCSLFFFRALGAASFRRSFASFFVSLAILATSRPILLFRFFNFILGSSIYPSLFTTVSPLIIRNIDERPRHIQLSNIRWHKPSENQMEQMG